MARITRVETVLSEGTLRPELTMRSALGAHVSRYVLVALTDVEGRIGWGEATVTPNWSGETQEGTESLIARYFAPALVGREAEEIAGALAVMEGIAVGNPFAKAAVEMALWDLTAQAAGKPLWQMLYPEAAPQPIPIRGSVAAVETEGAVSRALWFLGQGVRALKVKVGRGGVEADVERVRAVRAAIGPEVPLGVDANGGWSVVEAVTAARNLETCGLQYVEQPVARGDFAALRAVRDQVGVPVMADETVWTMADLETLLHLDAADIVSIYPGKMGGLLPSIRLAQRAAEAGKIVYIGSNLERDPGTAAMAHLAVGLPGANYAVWHSDLIGTLFHTESLSMPPLQPVHGEIMPPTSPGLGVTFGGKSPKVSL